MSWWSRRSKPVRRREEVKVSSIPTWKAQVDKLEHEPVLLGADELWGTAGSRGRAVSTEKYDSRETAERDHHALEARAEQEKPLEEAPNDQLHSSALARSASAMPASATVSSADAERDGQLLKTQSELPPSGGLAQPPLAASKSHDTPRALCNAIAEAKDDEESKGGSEGEGEADASSSSSATVDADGDESMKVGEEAVESTPKRDKPAADATAAVAGDDGEDGGESGGIMSPISVDDEDDDEDGDDEEDNSSSSSRKRKVPTAGGEIVYPDPDVQDALNAKVSIWQGDMTNLKCDAIVNAANSGLWAGGGICGAIHSRAGDALEDACRKIGYTQTGNTVITQGFRLPAKYVLHTVGPMNRDHALLESCYRTCMEVSLKHKIRTICFCCVSTGIFGFPREAAAKVALSTVRKWMLEPYDGPAKPPLAKSVSMKEKIRSKLPSSPSSNGSPPSHSSSPDPAAASSSPNSPQTPESATQSEAKSPDADTVKRRSSPPVRNMDFFDRVIFCTFLDADKEIYLHWMPRLFPPKSALIAHKQASASDSSPEKRQATAADTQQPTATAHANL